ncbi:BspA family leucine-rich repeat surface protein [Sulfurimonas sp.]
MKKDIAISIISAVFLVGCGSGGSSTSPSTPPTTSQAQFVDSPISNLDYTLNSSIQNNVTDNEGTFYYTSADKNITFKVGEMVLGTVKLPLKSNKVLPSELIGIDANNTTNENLIKIIRFLQSLDDDGDVNNGIQITDTQKDDINNLLDTNTSYNKNFIDNNISIINNLVTAAGKNLILEKMARNNYAKTLEKYGYTPTKMPFITVWEVSGDDKNITIPINPKYAGDYNYTVEWNDGNISKDVNDSLTHTYANDGNYTVKISGKFPAIFLNNDGKTVYDADYYDYIGNADRLMDVKKWGDIEWKSFEAAFAGAGNLKITSIDTPNLKNVKDMNLTFADCQHLNSNIDNWNVSNITGMRAMFSQATSFNQPLNNWNVSNVTDMVWMFNGAKSFNQPLNNWDVSNVTDMNRMFGGATSFNQPLNNWDVSNVTYMNGMFFQAKSFNQPLNNWDVSNVTDMEWMFGGATSFNQPLNNWNVSNVIGMGGMFNNAKSFDQNISMWDVSNVTYHSNFATSSPIDGTDKVPNFK